MRNEGLVLYYLPSYRPVCKFKIPNAKTVELRTY